MLKGVANDLAGISQVLISSLMPLFVAGVFYYFFNLVVTLFMNYIEKRLSYYN